MRIIINMVILLMAWFALWQGILFVGRVVFYAAPQAFTVSTLPVWR